MTAADIAIILKAATDLILLFRQNGITEADLDGAIRKEEERREALVSQI